MTARLEEDPVAITGLHGSGPMQWQRRRQRLKWHKKHGPSVGERRAVGDAWLALGRSVTDQETTADARGCRIRRAGRTRRTAAGAAAATAAAGGCCCCCNVEEARILHAESDGGGQAEPCAAQCLRVAVHDASAAKAVEQFAVGRGGGGGCECCTASLGVIVRGGQVGNAHARVGSSGEPRGIE